MNEAYEDSYLVTLKITTINGRPHKWDWRSLLDEPDVICLKSEWIERRSNEI